MGSENKLNEMVEKLKDKIFELRHKRSSVVAAAVVLVLIIGAFVFVPRIQKNIRAAEINSLVASQVTTKKVVFLDYQTADADIQNQNALSVMFAKPSGSRYNEIVKLLNSKKMDEFNRSLSIYPVVYGVDKIKEKYAIDPEKITLVFFEKGKEKTRYVIEDSTDLDTMFIPELNRLPMASVLTPESSAPAESTQASGAVAETTETVDPAATTPEEQVVPEASAVEPVTGE